MTDPDRGTATDGSSPEGAVSRRPAPDAGADGGSLSRDTIYTLLKNSRRRQVVRFLREHEEASLGELAEQIAARENGIEIDAVSSSQRKRVYIGLYQAHFPKLDDAGVVDFQKRRGTVTLTDRASELFPYLDPHREGPDRRLVVAALAAGTLALGLAVVDLGPVAGVPQVAWTATVWLALVGVGVAVLARADGTT